MINIIKSILKHEDKFLHFFASGWIFLFLTTIINSVAVCFFVTFLIGLAKEIYDYKWGNGEDMYDMVANILGIIVTLLIFFIL